jgi:hypothetical protein
VGRSPKLVPRDGGTPFRNELPDKIIVYELLVLTSRCD